MQYEFYVKYCVERLSQGSPAHLPLWATTRFFGRWIESCCQVGNRKVVTMTDYICGLSSSDLKRISGEIYLLKGNENDHLDLSNQSSKNSKMSLSNIRNKLSNIKNSVLNQISSHVTSLKIRYVWFDYHRKCKGGNVESLKEIFVTLKDSMLGSGGHFSCENIEFSKFNTKFNADFDEIKNGNSRALIDFKIKNENENEKGNSGRNAVDLFTVSNVQKNIIRTNCIDCLDRTNVVQTTIGRWALNHQLRKMGIYVSDGDDKSENND